MENEKIAMPVECAQHVEIFQQSTQKHNTANFSKVVLSSSQWTRKCTYFTVDWNRFFFCVVVRSLHSRSLFRVSLVLGLLIILYFFYNFPTFICNFAHKRFSSFQLFQFYCLLWIFHHISQRYSSFSASFRFGWLISTQFFFLRSLLQTGV